MSSLRDIRRHLEADIARLWKALQAIEACIAYRRRVCPCCKQRLAQGGRNGGN